MSATTIQLRQVSKSYRRGNDVVCALQRSTLELPPAVVTAIAGPSGSGKTTLLLIAGGLLRPDTGEVHWNGQEPYRLSADRRALLRAETTGFVFQQFHLIPYLTVLENVMTPGLAIPSTGSVASARTLLEEMRLSHRANHFPRELSTGERQRTALARAIFTRPRLLLADEPTANLDDESASLVIERLVAFARDDQRSVLVATHDRVLLDRAHQTLRMNAGQLCG